MRVPGRPELKTILNWNIYNPNVLTILPPSNRYPKNGQRNKYTVFSLNEKNSVWMSLHTLDMLTWWTNRQSQYNGCWLTHFYNISHFSVTRFSLLNVMLANVMLCYVMNSNDPTQCKLIKQELKEQFKFCCLLTLSLLLIQNLITDGPDKNTLPTLAYE